jgi:hypothetical protein
MSLIEKILGPRSKYDKTLPYSYEARVRVLEGSKEYNSYLAPTICGLLEHLQGNGIRPQDAQIYEIYQDRETLIDHALFTSPEQRWLVKPELCRAFEEHYPGHIDAEGCSFEDRDGKGIGP